MGQRLNDRGLIAIANKYPNQHRPIAPPQPKFTLLSRRARDRETKSPAQILIRWAIQHNLVVIPKSSDPARIRENADVFDFAITETDMQTLNGFNENLRTCWDPSRAP
jgi:diketogulonate reductase-like aldo/keto reductase